MIELLKTQPDGSQTWLIRHVEDDGEDIHKPQRYTVAPGTPESDVQAFADLVLANHNAGRPLTWREPTEADRLAEQRAREQAEQRRQRKEAIRNWEPSQGQLQARVAELESIVLMLIADR